MIEKIRIQGYRIYGDFTLHPNPRFNLIVGANESGKSTLVEAITLALTGKVNGRWASEELNPYWFNTDVVEDFAQKCLAGERVSWPEIRIELFFEDRDELQQLCGAANTDVPTNACPGITLLVLPDPDYAAERKEWAEDPSPLIPVEYYMVDWRSFADGVITSRPRHLVTAIIDSRTLRSSSGVDYHLRQILSDQLKPAERAAISLSYREVKAAMSEDALKAVNERMAEDHKALHDQPITLAMDQTTRTSWEGAVTPHVGNVPFSMYLTQVRLTPSGTECSALHATVQAWHPMQTRLSIANPIRAIKPSRPTESIQPRPLVYHTPYAHSTPHDGARAALR